MAINRQATSEEIKETERKLDKWLKIGINKSNVYKATYELLDAVPEDAKGVKKTWHGGYSSRGKWRYDTNKARTGTIIAQIEDETTKKLLWAKFVKLIKAIYKIDKDRFVLQIAGCLDLLLQKTKKDIQEIECLKPGNDTYVYLWDLGFFIGVYRKHQDKMQFMNGPMKMRSDIEKLIEYILGFIENRKDLNKYYYELTSWAEVYLLHGKPIPRGLHPVARYMVAENKKSMQQQKEAFERNTKQLKDHIKKLRQALK